MNEGMYSSDSEHWATPHEFFDRLAQEFGGFSLDPCATTATAKCTKFYTEADDGLAQIWTGNVFMNPPYGRKIGAWMRKAYESAQIDGATVVCLIPARVDTSWWHEYAMRAAEIRFVKGRISFGDGGPAPFPSAVVVFRPGETTPVLTTMANKGKR